MQCSLFGPFPKIVEIPDGKKWVKEQAMFCAVHNLLMLQLESFRIISNSGRKKKLMLA